MRQAYCDTAVGPAAISYPDEVCFAFNHNFINIQLKNTAYRKVEVQVGIVQVGVVSYSNSIDVALFEGKSNIYISRVFQLMFCDIRLFRSAKLKVALICSGKELFSFETLCIFGAIGLGERFGSYGVYSFDQSQPFCKRHCVWFRAFPFKISLMRFGNDSFIVRHNRESQALSLDEYKMDKVFLSEIDDITNALPALSSEQIASPAKVILYSRLNRILAWTPDERGGKYYETWSGSNRQLGPSSDYMDEDKAPRTDIGYLIKDSNNIDHLWITENGKIVDKGVHMDPIGFYDFNLSSYIKDFNSNTNHIVIRQEIDEYKRISVFDNTFGHTFHPLSETSILTVVDIKDESDGLYLRWIDGFGQLQYYLFTIGSESCKNKADGVTLQKDMSSNGSNYFSGLLRNSKIQIERRINCCACGLTDEIFGYVSTISQSVCVDMFIGNNKGGEELWFPVRVADGTITKRSKNKLHDIEIELLLPNKDCQSL